LPEGIFFRQESSSAVAMLNFERSSLSQKLTLTSLLSTGSALLVVFAAFAFATVHHQRAAQERQLATLAEITGAQSIVPLLAADHGAAQQVLSVLAAQPGIQRAALFDRNGAPFAAAKAEPVSTLVPDPEVDTGSAVSAHC
jgi:hypothetical protein